jgi:hypothetical protein
METILKQFDQPDEIRHFEKGTFELLHLEGRTLGRATYQPGWKWSVDVGPDVGKTLCEVEHFGIVLAGHTVVAFEDGTVEDLRAGTVFYIPPVPHDSWVVGDEPYVSLHIGGAERYAK